MSGRGTSATGRAAMVAVAGVVGVLVSAAGRLEAASPAVIAVQAVLRTAGGGPVADGKYVITFRLYENATAKTALFKELHPVVPVHRGLLHRTVGGMDANNPLPLAVFTGGKALWLGVQVSDDPELPRVRLAAVPYALHARRAGVAAAVSGPVDGKQLVGGSVGSSALAVTYAGSAIKGGPATLALDVTCTGCVGVAELKFDDDVNLGTRALLANRVTAQTVAAGTVIAQAVHATSFIGDGGQLTGLPKPPSGSCPAGAHVRGIKPDGTLTCGSAVFERSGKSGLEVAIKAPLVLEKGSDHRWQPAAGFRLAAYSGPPAACDAKMAGALYADAPTGGLRYCNGASWIALGDVSPLGAKGKPVASCKALKAALPGAKDGPYWLDPDGPGKGAAPFVAWCDMSTSGGGWTMCVTDNQSWRIRSESKSAGTYGKDGYRADCRGVAFTDILYVRHDNKQFAAFRRDGGQALTMEAVGAAHGWDVAGSVLGAWSRLDGVASAKHKYQVLICDHGWMPTGLFVSGTTGCYKQCGSWCSDRITQYFRFDGDNGGSYNGVAFAENGHRNVANKLMSVGVR